MAFIRSSLITVGIATALVSAAANTVSDRMLVERENGTTTHLNNRPQPEYDYRTAWLCGVDLPGGDTWVAQHPDPESCEKNCLPQTGCDAGTWTNANGGTCYFKRLLGSWASAVPKAGAISFFRGGDKIGPFIEPTFPVDVDMPGNDISHDRGASIGDCKNACGWISTCFAYTWTPFEGGTCWFKSKPVAFVPSVGAKSGYLSRWSLDDCKANY
jgi:hypothetical protein